jgi:phosphopantetheinyl transferase
MTLPIGVTIRYSAFDSALDERIDAAETWLGAAERHELERLGDASRRRQWLGGRWLAKQLVGEAFDVGDPTQVDILTRDERGRGVTPRVTSRLHELRLSLSISHTEVGVLVALSKMNRLSIGVDLAPRQIPVQDGFWHLWFTPFERQWMERDPENRTAVIWAAKEAIYKVANKGRFWNPRQIEVRRQGQSGFECSYGGRLLQGLSIELRKFDGQTAAIACLRRAARACRTDVPSQAQPMGVSRRTVRPSGQAPRFIVWGF